MEINAKLIITAFLVAFKVFVILNFILKFRRMKKRVAELENELAELKGKEETKKIA